MFTTGLGPVANSAFSLTSFVIGIPTGVKVFNWLGTMWGGRLWFSVPMLYAQAFLITFTLGGITGIMVAMPPFDAQAQDSYFIVAHFHYVMGGGALLSFLAGLYYWFPKITGKMLSESWGKLAFWLIVPGFHVIFFPQHLLGLMGMPRRIQTYDEGLGFELWNFVSSAGTFMMGLGMAVVFAQVIASLRGPRNAPDDPWDARTLEWATTSPPVYYDFEKQPVAYGQDALWLRKHPELIDPQDAEEIEDVDYDAGGIHVPGPSWYPFLMALTIILGGYGVLYQNWVFSILMSVFVVFFTYAWAFEGVGGHHVHPEPDAEGSEA